jgi:pilus assembly protein CpaE
LIAADKDLSREFQETLPGAKSFQILNEIHGYPTPQVLEMRLNQLKPQAVLIDVESDLARAEEVIQYIAGTDHDLVIVGIHSLNDSAAILRSLRAGASEFLHSPFDPTVQREAVARLIRLSQPTPSEALLDREFAGNLLCISSTKPGAGSSTVATQVAFAIHRLTGGRVLLADFDLVGGAIGFYLRLEHRASLLDALLHAEHLAPHDWSSMAENCSGIDILPAPAEPYAGGVENNRLAVVLDSARRSYDWIIVDLPMIFQRISMMTASQSDRTLLITTPELPSLHLARKSVALLEQIGLPKDRVQMLVNRVSRWDGIGVADLEKLFNCPVFSSLPNDYFSLHRAITLGQPLGPEGDLGKSLDALAAKLSGTSAPSGKKAVEVGAGRAILSPSNG